jgi:Tfp pilus assembly protein PilF
VALSAGGFNVVLTTNFDDLLADALYLYTDARPLIIHHESLAAYIRPTRTRPLLIKLHGDHRLSPRNTVLETQNLAEEFQRHAAMVLHDRGIIFMGYGGADLGILKMLNDLPSEALPFGAYWVHPEEPRGQVREWLARRQGVWVRSGWFDEVMLLVRNAFDLPHPSPDRFTRIFDEYQQKFKALSAAIQEKPSTEAGVQALKEAVASAEAVLPGFWKPMVEAYRLENQDPDRADEIYRHGVAEFPEAVLLRVAYANFLWYIRRSYDVAEATYRQALDADPKNAELLGNYGLFLEEVRKDYEAAETMYKRALDCDPKNSNALRIYASFLSDIRKNQDAAEMMFRRALEFDPENADTLSGYAFFLSAVRKDYDTAEVMYKRSLEADPTRLITLGNYANFLKTIRKNYDAAEAMYKRALEAGPKNANIISNYAGFINDVRKDYETAEVMYRRALDVAPDNPNMNANLARLMLAEGNADGMTILHRAIALLRETPFPAAEIECAFYLLAHGIPPERFDALRTVRKLLEAGVRSSNWDFSRNIERARLDGHPEVSWLGKLASVINDEARPELLNGWPAWEKAAA